MTFSNFNKWKSSIEKNAVIVLKASHEVLDAAADEFKKRVEERTPVGDPSLWKWPAHAGYVPGTLRASWTKTKTGSGSDITITIKNSIPYGPVIEYTGHSTQAPQGMMRITAMEWPDIVASVAARKKK